MNSGLGYLGKKEKHFIGRKRIANYFVEVVFNILVKLVSF